MAHPPLCLSRCAQTAKSGHRLPVDGISGATLRAPKARKSCTSQMILSLYRIFCGEVLLRQCQRRTSTEIEVPIDLRYACLSEREYRTHLVPKSEWRRSYQPSPPALVLIGIGLFALVRGVLVVRNQEVL